MNDSKAKKIKISILGETKVGKTQLINQYMESLKDKWEQSDCIYFNF